MSAHLPAPVQPQLQRFSLQSESPIMARILSAIFMAMMTGATSAAFTITHIRRIRQISTLWNRAITSSSVTPATMFRTSPSTRTITWAFTRCLTATTGATSTDRTVITGHRPDTITTRELARTTITPITARATATTIRDTFTTTCTRITIHIHLFATTTPAAIRSA